MSAPPPAPAPALAPISPSSLRPLDVRSAVRATHPESIEHIDGTTFDLPDGSLLSRRPDGAWTLLSGDGSAALQIRTLPQLSHALRQRLLVLPAVVLSLLEDIEVRQTRTHSRLLGDLEERLHAAEQLGVVAREGASSWRLTDLGTEVARKMRRGNYVAVMLADAAEAQP